MGKATALRNKVKVSPANLANGLGWFSIGLGIAQIAAPQMMCRLAGLRMNPANMRLLGVREALTGISILGLSQKKAGIQARVAGDAMDLAILGSALLKPGNDQTRLAAALTTVAGITALDALCARQFSAPPTHGNGQSQARMIQVKRAVTINRDPQELYVMWHNFADLPRFMSHLQEVQVVDEKHSHWVARAPMGRTVEWDAEITEDIPGKRIAWNSMPRSIITNHGQVTFEPATGNRGTVVRIELEYRPPGGWAGAKLAKLFGEAPEKQIAVDLQRFKQKVETGEIARTEGQSAGRAKSTSRKFDDLVRA